MKIIKVLEKTELVIVDLEVNLGKEKRNGLTLCVKYNDEYYPCLLYTSPSPRDLWISRMPSSA